MTTGEILPYIRVDEEIKKVVQRVQAFFRLAEGKTLTEGNTVKEIFKECSFSIAGPEGSTETIHYPFESFEVKHVKSNRDSRD
ncbi:hypothetical protein ES703_104905 [subsurface metagenome]